MAVTKRFFMRARLAESRQARNPTAETSLYQRNATAGTGNVCGREWFRYLTPSASGQYEKIITSWDNRVQQAFSVGITTGVTKTGFDVLGLVRGRWGFPELKRRVGLEADFWKPTEILVGDAQWKAPPISGELR
jgi:hypothetical protein